MSGSDSCSGGFTFERNGTNGKHILGALGQWLRLELTEGWRTWFAKEHVPLPDLKPAPATRQT